MTANYKIPPSINKPAPKNMRHIFWAIFACLLSVIYLGCLDISTLPAATPEADPQIQVVAEGLLNPVGLALLPDGSLLVAEEGTGKRDHSAGVSLITSEGQVGRLISGFSSSRDSGDLAGVNLVALSPRGDKIYIGHFNDQQLWTLPLSLETQIEGLKLPETPLTVDQLTPAMTPLNNVYLTNPFDLTFDLIGVPVVTDASGNGVAKETAAGATRFIHRFERLANQATETEADAIDPVPTGITRVGEAYYVTLTGGCPYPEGGGQLVWIDENRNQRTAVRGLNMPIDVAQGPDETIWVLEFARFTPGASCFDSSSYQPHTGRLSRFTPPGDFQPVLSKLNYPGAVLPLPDGSLYISEVFTGRILHITFAAAQRTGWFYERDEQPEPDTKIIDSTVAAEEIESTPIVSQTEVEQAVSQPVEQIQATATSPPPQVTAPPAAGLHLRDVAAEVGLDFQQRTFQTGLFMDPIAMMGGGLCWLDYNNDGWFDLYLINSYAKDETDYWQTQGGLPRNALYRNNGMNGDPFSDVSAEAGADLALRGNGCVAADFNQDGWWDIYITADGPNALLWNQGDGTFIEGGEAAGLAAPEWNSAAVVGDLNADGWPDLFVAAYIDLEKKIPNPSGAFPQDFYGLPDHLYLNTGLTDGEQWPTFREITGLAGLGREERGLGALFSDLDNDGDLDLYIANDGHPNRLYVNEPWPGGLAKDPEGIGFRFVDLTDTAAAGDSGSGMGVAGGDYDGDGWLDLFITNWQKELNALYRNEMAEEGHLTFQYSTYRIGISGMGNELTGWGTAWADLDHDTDLDLLVANGRVPVTDLVADRQLVRFYRNRSHNLDGREERPGQFIEWTQQVGLREVGPLMARGSALADYDNDGDLDAAINTIANPVVLLQSEGVQGHWLQVQLPGFYPGAKAIVTLPDGRQLVRESHAGSSYLASEDPRLHFGLGTFDRVDQLTVILPDGRQFTFDDVAADQIVAITE